MKLSSDSLAERWDVHQGKHLFYFVTFVFFVD